MLLEKEDVPKFAKFVRYAFILYIMMIIINIFGSYMSASIEDAYIWAQILNLCLFFVFLFFLLRSMVLAHVKAVWVVVLGLLSFVPLVGLLVAYKLAKNNEETLNENGYVISLLGPNVKNAS